MLERMSRPLIVVCAGGFAAEIASYIRGQQVVGGPIFVRGFVDDHRFESTFEGAPLLGSIAELGGFLADHPADQFSYVTAIGDNRARADIVRRVEGLEAPNLTPLTLVHTSAVVGDTVSIGAGSCVGPGAVVTARVTIGSHCVLDANCSVSHDAEIGSYVNVGPGGAICADVTIGTGCTIGAGATVSDGVQVGGWSVIGAGAVVTEDVPAHVTVVGSPARIVQRHGRGARLSTFVG